MMKIKYINNKLTTVDNLILRIFFTHTIIYKEGWPAMWICHAPFSSRLSLNLNKLCAMRHSVQSLTNHRHARNSIEMIQTRGAARGAGMITSFT